MANFPRRAILLNEYFMWAERAVVNKALGVSAALIANPIRHGTRNFDVALWFRMRQYVD